MHNDRTPNFDLPLPHAENDLSDDVVRLREALQKTDTALNAAGDKATWAGLTGRPATFPPATHQHPWTDNVTEVERIMTVLANQTTETHEVA